MKKVKYSYEFWEHIDDFLDFLSYPEPMKAQAITKYAQYLEKRNSSLAQNKHCAKLQKIRK